MRLLNGRGLARADDLLRPLNKGEGYINFLGDNGVSAEEADEAAAVYTAEQARGLNVMLNEIPFYSDDEFTVVLSQSMSISVPPQVSLVQNLCLSQNNRDVRNQNDNDGNPRNMCVLGLQP